MPRMPYLPGVAGLASMSSFAIVSLPSYVFATSSSTGANILHGPHHSAQKSTSTGLSDLQDVLVEGDVGDVLDQCRSWRFLGKRARGAAHRRLRVGSVTAGSARAQRRAGSRRAR